MTSLPPPPGGAPPPPPFGGQPPPPQGPQNWGQPGPVAPTPKKKKKWPWVVGGVVALFVVAAIAGGGKSDDDAKVDSAASVTTTTAAGTPDTPVTTGTPDTAAAPTTAAPTTAPPTTAEAPLPTIAGVQGERDEIDDITMTRCGVGDFGNYGEVDITVVNNSSKPSTYFIEIRMESKDGKTSYGTANAVVDNLGPGQTKQDKASALDEIPNPDDVRCLIASVSRMAS